MNLPNLLALARIVLTPVVMAFILLSEQIDNAFGIAVVIFVIALFGQFAYYHSSPTVALGVSAYITNFIVSASFVFYYLNWPDPQCHSLQGAWLKFLGTGIITVANLMLVFSGGGLTKGEYFLVYLMLGTSFLDIGYLVLLYRLLALKSAVSAAHS